MEQVGVQFIAAGGDVYITTVKNATTATNTFVDATEKGGGRVSGAGQVMIGALRQVGTMAVEAFAQAAKATAAFVGDSIKVAGDFEAGMHKFQAVAGKGVDTKGLEKFKDLFISLGKELPVSTSEVEQAAIEMVSGGIDPAIVAGGALRQTIQFAAASGLSLADAAKTSAKFLAGWTSSAATTAEKVDFLTLSTDVLTKAAAASSTTAAELRLGLFNVQGAAQALHASFSDTTATLALLAPAFESSAQAGTALNVFMTRLVPQTKDATAILQDLGIITESNQNLFFDSQGAFLGMGNAAELLKTKMAGLTDEQKISQLHTLFGNDAMKVGNLLMQDGAAGLEGMIAKMNEANGVSATAALMQSGYNTALENAKGSVEALQIRIGSFLIPVLTDLLNNWVAPGINSVTAFAESFFKMVPAIAASDDPLQSFLNALKVAAPQFLDTISSIESFKDSLLEFVAPAKEVAAFLGDNLKPILFGIGTAITVAVLPALVASTAAFLAAAAPIVALVAAGALLYKAWDSDFLGIRTTVTQVWNDALLPAFKDMQAWLAEKIPPAIKTLADFWTGTLQPALKDVWAFLNDKVFPVLNDLVDIYIAAAIIEVKALADMWTNYLWPALKTVWAFLDSTVIPIFKALFDVEFAIASKAVEALAGLWQKVLWPAIKSVSEFITSTVVPAFEAAGDYLNQTFGPTLTSVGKWLDNITGGFGGVSGAVKDVINLIEGLATSISTLKLPSWLTPGSPTPWEIALYGIGNALSKSVAPGLKSMQQGVTEIGQQISDTFGNTDLVDQLEGLGDDIMGGFVGGMKKGMRGVVTYIDSAANNVEDAFNDAFGRKSPAKRMIPIGEDVSLGFLKGLSDMWPSVTAAVSAMGEDLIKQAADIAATVQDAIGDAFGATASIDRQMAKNLESLGKMSDDFYKNATENALRSAAEQAKAFADPTVGAKYYKMRSAQIFEFQDLQKRINEETDADTRASLQQQQILILKAQEAEQSAFDATNSRTKSAMTDLIAEIGLLFNNPHLQDLQKQLSEAKTDADKARIQQQINEASIPVNDTGLGHDLMELLRQLEIQAGTYTPPPHLASGGFAKRGNPYWVGEDGPELFWPGTNGTVMPAVSSQQLAAQASTTTYNGQVGNTFSMPIYTNNTPAIIQQSMAIAQAVIT